MINEEVLAEEFSMTQAWDRLLESLLGMFGSFIDHVPNLFFGLLVLVMTWAVSWGAQRVYWKIFNGRRVRRSLKDLISKLISIAIWVAGLLAASVVVFPSVKPESVLAGLGLSSIAIGFAFKDVVENFFAGFLILLREPMEIGDVVECNDVEGRVEEITIRDTMIRKLDGQCVLVPNAMLFKNPVTIRTDREKRRVSIACGVSYDADLDEARQVILEATQGASTVLDEPKVQVLAQQFGGSSIDFDVLWWTASQPMELRQSRDEVVRCIKSALDQAGIEIPFPQRVLHVPGPLQVNAGAEQTDD